MAIDVKTISCPQCGSTDVEMTSETQGICASCGTKFTVQQRINTQNVYNEIHVCNEDESEIKKNVCRKRIIIPEYPKEIFLRQAWISLAEEDAPLDVFDQNFGEVAQIEHQVLIDSVSANLTYQAGIGYDRQEPYIDYETYVEKEPYIDYEKQYNRTTGQYEERQVTKYKDVKKQRQVTKYRTVTDWSAQSGNRSVYAVATVENIPGLDFDEVSFGQSFEYSSPKSFSEPSEEKASEMQVTSEAHEAAVSKQANFIARQLCDSLPGDHYRDLDYNIAEVTDSSTSLYSCQEYEVELVYNGKTYKKRAFPFGTLEIFGDKIKNNLSLNEIKDDMQSKLDKRIKDRCKERDEKISKRRKEIDLNILKSTKGITFLSIALLVLSIIISIFVHLTALVVIAFVLAVASFIANLFAVKKADADENQKASTEIDAISAKANKEIDEERAKGNAEIKDYSSNYKQKRREALDRKLISLGLTPTSVDELSDDNESDDDEYDDDEYDDDESDDDEYDDDESDDEENEDEEDEEDDAEDD